MKYKSRYPIDLCLAYMKNDNINDVFEYTWEECEGKYCITYLVLCQDLVQNKMRGSAS